MNDKELLELAAKAYGIEVTAVVPDGIPHRFGGGYWNPLTDDGDALRLAVGLKIEVFPQVYRRDGSDARNHHGEYFTEMAVDNGDDIYAATRRVIIRAAAEIGRSMK